MSCLLLDVRCLVAVVCWSLFVFVVGSVVCVVCWLVIACLLCVVLCSVFVGCVCLLFLVVVFRFVMFRLLCVDGDFVFVVCWV